MLNHLLFLISAYVNKQIGRLMRLTISKHYKIQLNLSWKLVIDKITLKTPCTRIIQYKAKSKSQT